MKLTTVQLGTIAKFIRGITFKPTDLVEPHSSNSVVCMRTKNVQADLDLDDIIAVPEQFVKRDEQIISHGDILMSSANSWNLVGKCSWVPELPFTATAGGFISILRGNGKFVDTRYLYYWLNSPLIQHNLRYCGRQTTNISNLDLNRVLEIEIPLPPLTEQKRIAAILDKADAIRRKRQQAIQLADDFLRAVFLDMFGDPVTNPKGWNTGSLASFGTLKNGLNYNKVESGVQMKCLGVGDFGSLSKITDIASLSTIDLDTCPSKEYFLQNDDLVFVRSNGNKELVGRCVVVYPGNENLTFSGFCIRYRVESGDIEPIYLSYLFRVGSFRRMMLQNGQGANIQNISQAVLNRLQIPIPHPDVQRQFATIVKSVEQQQIRINKHLEKINVLFSSLSQRAFRGEL